MTPYASGKRWTLYAGDAVETMAALDAGSIDAVVTDPPYGLEFMGKAWDKLDGGAAGMSAPGIGVRAIPWPSYGGDPHGGANPTCALCGGRARGAKRCACAAPDWRVKGETREATGRVASAKAQQEWHGAWAREVIRVLKPGGHLLAFGGTRTYHRLACAIEDAGFEIRDSLLWLYGSGFPKSLNVGEGRGTALKPAHEPIVVARKPLIGTVAANVERHGTGAINIDGCRAKLPAGEKVHDVRSDPANRGGVVGADWSRHQADTFQAAQAASVERTNTMGRWPPNVLLGHADGCERIGERIVRGDGHFPAVRPAGGDRAGAAGHAGQGGLEERSLDGEVVEAWRCVEGCPVALLDAQSGPAGAGGAASGPSLRDPTEATRAYGARAGLDGEPPFYGDEGGASRFFPQFYYSAKAAKAEREAGLQESKGRANTHPTVKPVALMQWLCRLVTPAGGVVLDPFAGSGTTGLAALREGFSFIGIEKADEYAAIAARRIGEDMPLFHRGASP